MLFLPLKFLDGRISLGCLWNSKRISFQKTTLGNNGQKCLGLRGKTYTLTPASKCFPSIHPLSLPMPSPPRRPVFNEELVHPALLRHENITHQMRQLSPADPPTPLPGNRMAWRAEGLLSPCLFLRGAAWMSGLLCGNSGTQLVLIEILTLIAAIYGIRFKKENSTIKCIAKQQYADLENNTTISTLFGVC